MFKKLFISTLFLLTGISIVSAQAVWVSGEFKYSPVKKFGVSAEAEYRSSDGLEGTDRITLGVGVDYKPFKFLKFDAGYDYLRQHKESEITKRGNIIPDYWVNRHRGYFAATGSINLGQFEISLRERYQFTRRIGKWVPKFDSDGTTPKDDEYIPYKNKHILRSRIECDYNIRKSRFSPFVSVELYDNLSEQFAIDKVRYTAGCNYKINKHNRVELFYRYIQVPKSNVSEDCQNVIGIEYTFKL